MKYLLLALLGLAGLARTGQAQLANQLNVHVTTAMHLAPSYGARYTLPWPKHFFTLGVGYDQSKNRNALSAGFMVRPPDIFDLVPYVGADWTSTAIDGSGGRSSGYAALAGLEIQTPPILFGAALRGFTIEGRLAKISGQPHKNELRLGAVLF